MWTDEKYPRNTVGCRRRPRHRRCRRPIVPISEPSAATFRSCSIPSAGMAWFFDDAQMMSRWRSTTLQSQHNRRQCVNGIAYLTAPFHRGRRALEHQRDLRALGAKQPLLDTIDGSPVAIHALNLKQNVSFLHHARLLRRTLGLQLLHVQRPCVHMILMKLPKRDANPHRPLARPTRPVSKFSNLVTMSLRACAEA